MPLEPAAHISELVPTNPTPGDPKSQGDDHIRNVKISLLNDLAGFEGAIMCTGVDGGAANTYTVTPARAIAGYGLRMIVIFAATAANTGASTLNISSLGAKPLKSVEGLDLVQGDLVPGTVYAAYYNGAEFRLSSVTKNYVDQIIFSGSLPAQSLGFLRSDGGAAGFTQSHAGYAVNESKGADIKSAATINLTTATGNLVHITGTTSINAITIPVGAERELIFDGTLTLANNAALALPGGANIVTAAGDCATVRGDTAGARVTKYVRATGQSLAAVPYMKISDQKPSTAGGGGTSVSGDSTQTRVLNTVNVNTISGASLASDSVTLPAGSYDVRVRAPAFQAAGHQASLYNVTDSSYALTGSVQYCGNSSGVQTDATVIGRVTIASQKAFTVRHFIAGAFNAIGLGLPSPGGGLVTIYTEVEFWKVA